MTTGVIQPMGPPTRPSRKALAPWSGPLGSQPLTPVRRPDLALIIMGAATARGEVSSSGPWSCREAGHLPFMLHHTFIDRYVHAYAWQPWPAARHGVVSPANKTHFVPRSTADWLHVLTLCDSSRTAKYSYCPSPLLSAARPLPNPVRHRCPWGPSFPFFSILRSRSF